MKNSREMSFMQTAALLGSLAATVAAHGHVQGIVANGVFYEGYNPAFQYDSPPPVVIGWSTPEDLDNGFIDPTNYTTPEIICHLGATPAGTSAKIAAGQVVELQWTPWPDSHHGPVLNYLANCNGDCSTVDKTTLEFFNIDTVGLINDNSPPGTWASDQLIANNNSWEVTIPKNIKPGSYVLRHEIIALHSAEQENGAQNYPQCINLEISGSGTDEPAGTLGEKLYTENEPGILINIYQSLRTYQIPGPTVIAGAVSMKQGKAKTTAMAPTGSAAAVVTPSTTAVSTTAAETTSTHKQSAKPASSSQIATKPYKPSSSKSSSSSVVSAKASSSSGPISTKSSNSASPVSAETSSQSTKCKQTITITSSKASKVSVATLPTSASLSASPAPMSALSSLASALPPSLLTKTLSDLPTGTGAAPVAPIATAPGGKGSGGFGLEAPPKGTTLKQLFEWMDYMLMRLFREGEGKHGRDLSGH